MLLIVDTSDEKRQRTCSIYDWFQSYYDLKGLPTIPGKSNGKSCFVRDIAEKKFSRKINFFTLCSFKKNCRACFVVSKAANYSRLKITLKGNLLYRNKLLP